MFLSVSTVLFWALFPIGILIVAARLIAIFRENGRVEAARWHFDEGRDEGKGYEIYRLSLRSGRLAALAAVLAVCAVAAGIAGAFGDPPLKIAASAVSAALILAAGRLRARHAALTAGVEGLAGEPLERAHRRVYGGEMTLA